MDYQSVVNDIRDLLATIDRDLKKSITNQSAGQRVRVNSIKLGKGLVDFRRICLEHSNSLKKEK